jgi:hypothetical protein
MVDKCPAEMSTTGFSVGEPLSDQIGKILVGRKYVKSLLFTEMSAGEILSSTLGISKRCVAHILPDEDVRLYYMRSCEVLFNQNVGVFNVSFIVVFGAVRGMTSKTW